MNNNNNNNLKTCIKLFFFLCLWARCSHGPPVYDPSPWSDYITKLKVKTGLNLCVLIIAHFKHLCEHVWSAHVHFCGYIWPTQSHAQFLSFLYFWILKFLGFFKPRLLEMSTPEPHVPRQGVGWVRPAGGMALDFSDIVFYPWSEASQLNLCDSSLRSCQVTEGY